MRTENDLYSGEIAVILRVVAFFEIAWFDGPQSGPYGREKLAFNRLEIWVEKGGWTSLVGVIFGRLSIHRK